MMSSTISVARGDKLGWLLSKYDAGSYPLKFNVEGVCVITVSEPNPKTLTIEECYDVGEGDIRTTNNILTVSYDPNVTCETLMARVLTNWVGNEILGSERMTYESELKNQIDNEVHNGENNNNNISGNNANYVNGNTDKKQNNNFGLGGYANNTIINNFDYNGQGKNIQNNNVITNYNNVNNGINYNQQNEITSNTANNIKVAATTGQQPLDVSTAVNELIRERERMGERIGCMDLPTRTISITPDEKTMLSLALQKINNNQDYKYFGIFKEGNRYVAHHDEIGPNSFILGTVGSLPTIDALFNKYEENRMKLYKIDYNNYGDLLCWSHNGLNGDNPNVGDFHTVEQQPMVEIQDRNCQQYVGEAAPLAAVQKSILPVTSVVPAPFVQETYEQPVNVPGGGVPFAQPVFVQENQPGITTAVQTPQKVVKKIVAKMVKQTEEDMRPNMVKLNKGRTKEKMTRMKVGQEQQKGKPVVETRVMRRFYKTPQQKQQVAGISMNINPPRGIPDVPLKKEEPEKIDITVGEPKKMKKKKKARVGAVAQKKTKAGKHIHDLYNIRTVENSQSAAPIEQPAVQAPAPAPVPEEKQRPINIFMEPEKKAEPAHNIQDHMTVGLKPQDIQDNISVKLKPQDIQDKININFNHEKLLDDIKELLTKQSKNNVGQIPPEYIQLVENLQVELRELGEKMTGNIVIDNDVILEEIRTLKEQIEKEKTELKGDSFNVEFNYLAEVNEKLQLIEDALQGLKKTTENNVNDSINVEFNGYDKFAKSIGELRADVQNLKEKNAAPSIQEITDELSVLLEEKLKNQDRPQQDIHMNDQTTVQNDPPAPIVIDGLQELKNEIKNEIRNEINTHEKYIPEKYEPKIVIDPPEEPNIHVKDEIEVVQKTPEKEKKEEIIENVYKEVDKPVKKEENETVITNEYKEISKPKKEETIITNEYQEKREPIVQMPAAPTPMPGFMAHQMMPVMMPPVFMPPPMPMPVPAQQPQQPIVITQNQSDEEEGNSFWSTFWKVFLTLLLLASLIGVGILLWKNMQKTNDRKPDKKPEPDKQPDQNPKPEKAEEVTIKPDKPVDQGPIKTGEGQTAQPICEDGKNLQLNVNAEKVSLGADTGALTSDAKNAINLENAGTHNKLIAADGTTIDTRRIEITGNQISARDWNGSLSNAKTYTGTIQNGQAVINGKTYTIANESGQAYSSGAIDVASQTSYTRNSDQTLSTNFGTLKQDMQINKNNTFTLDTKTEKGTVIASNTVDDISGNTTMQNILKEKLNDSKITQGEYNRIMDALDDGKLNSSYLRAVSNTSHISLDNNHAVGNSTGV